MDAQHDTVDASSAAASAAESVWTREEIVQLLRAWRLVASDHSAAPDEASDARVFDAFRAASTSKDASALVAMMYNLMRSYKFVAEFNTNYAAKAASAVGAAEYDGEARNHWFQTLTEQQREVHVRASFSKMRTMQFVSQMDEEIFNELRVLAGLQKQKRQSKLKRVLDNVSVRWSRDEIMRLLRAWREALEQGGDAVAQETNGVLNARAFERFTALSEPHTPLRRSKAFNGKRKHLMTTFKYILEFNAERRAANQPEWFTMRESEREQRVYELKQQSKHSFIDLDEAMFAQLQVIHGIEESFTEEAREAKAAAEKRAQQELAIARRNLQLYGTLEEPASVPFDAEFENDTPPGDDDNSCATKKLKVDPEAALVGVVRQLGVKAAALNTMIQEIRDKIQHEEDERRQLRNEKELLREAKRQERERRHREHLAERARNRVLLEELVRSRNAGSSVPDTE
ncbi:hypothetical protein FI667_g16457, partial [Globisporangium splendens]